MMHFELKDKEGNSLIAEENFDLAIPFCGLVETQFGLSYAEYQMKLETELSHLYEILNRYLGFDLLLHD